MITYNSILSRVAVTAVLCLVSACRQERLSLVVAHAAEPETTSEPAMKPVVELNRSCYAFMLRRPRDQRALAVQARLKQADQMAKALDSRTFAVDLVGDHANILSLQFPIEWPAPPLYTRMVSTVIDDYFAAPEVQDYLCNSGFDRVRLSARGTNDRRLHPVWTAEVTTEGLVKLTAEQERIALR